MGPSWVQILVVAVVVVLLLGRGRVASLMSEVAQGIRGFRKGMREMDDPLTLEADAASEDKVQGKAKSGANEKHDAVLQKNDAKKG